MIVGIFLILTLASWIYWLVAADWTRQFFRRSSPIDRIFAPPVSILKPVKGVDPEALENFVSFCQQDYPCYEILFGVANAQDPAVPIVKRLQAQFPGLSIRLFVSPQNVPNEKAGLLHTLAGQARYSFLAISDSDMRVTPDYLSRVIAPLADDEVGLVTCPYQGARPITFTARLEALHMGVTFLPSVIVARKILHMRFAMGSTIALRQRDLRRMGGFLAIADYLADDYQIGARMAGLGLKVVLSDYIVASVLGATSFREQWQREVRWSHCNRISRPLEYPGLLLSFASPLAFCYLVMSGFSALGWLALAISLLERYWVGWLVIRSTNDRVSRNWLVWLPVRDFLSALIWLVGLVGRQVVWRGGTFLVRSDGKLQSVRQLPGFSLKELPGQLFARLVPGIDWILRRLNGIFEFDQDERCILRLSLKPCGSNTILSDGTLINKGELIGELHFWNEHIPPIPKNGADVPWALAFHRRIVHSFKSLSEFITSEPAFSRIKAFHGTPPFGGRFGDAQVADMAQRWGFEVIEKPAPRGLSKRFYQFWDSFYAWGLLLAFNPGSLHDKRMADLHRNQWWITRHSLLDHYMAHQNLVDQVDRVPDSTPAASQPQGLR